MCGGHRRSAKLTCFFRYVSQAVGHFVPTAHWDKATGSLHVDLKRLRLDNGRLTGKP
jgi:hypothetical protein